MKLSEQEGRSEGAERDCTQEVGEEKQLKQFFFLKNNIIKPKSLCKLINSDKVHMSHRLGRILQRTHHLCTHELRELCLLAQELPP